MTVVYSGTSAPRSYDREPSREHTLQFRAPVFDSALIELEARMILMAKYRERSHYAKARLQTIAACYRSGNERVILDAFDKQNAEALWQ